MNRTLREEHANVAKQRSLDEEARLVEFTQRAVGDGAWVENDLLRSDLLGGEENVGEGVEVDVYELGGHARGLGHFGCVFDENVEQLKGEVLLREPGAERQGAPMRAEAKMRGNDGGDFGGERLAHRGFGEGLKKLADLVAGEDQGGVGVGLFFFITTCG